LSKAVVAHFRTDNVTAEPRIEDLLASIRRAIEDDVGALPQPIPEQAAVQTVPPTERAARLSDELAAAASELKQLRERISRAPAPETPRTVGIIEAIEAAPLQRPGSGARPRSALAEAEFARRPQSRPESTHLRPVSQTEAQAPAGSDVLLSESSAQAVQLAFGRLASTAAASVSERQVEEMTRELLHGMLKSWLDQNLPGLVERLVREEIARVARGGR
jgi:cell pole-organizing protein PopZ